MNNRSHVVWSWYQAKDSEERLLLHAELERRAGRKMDCPELLEEPVIAAVVGRVDGKLRHVLFLEAEAELQSGAANVLAPAELEKPLAMLTEAAQFYHLRVVRSFVPAGMLATQRNRKPAIARIFEKLGFSQEEPALLTQFYKWLPKLKAKAKAQVA